MSELQAEQLAIDKLIKPWEGLRLEAYQDQGGVWTIGYGHTAGVTAGQKITQAYADALLKQDVAWAFFDVRSFVHVTLNENQFAALISFEFNTGAPSTSEVYVNINKNDFPAAMDVLMEWINVDGQPSAGLINRRTAEKALFNS